MNICPHCGASLWDNARFCPCCMTPLNQKRVIATYLPTRRRWLPIAAAVLVFIGIGLVLWMNRSPKTEETVAVGDPSTTRTDSTATTDTTTDSDATTTGEDKTSTSKENTTASKGETATSKGETATSKGETATGKGETATGEGTTTTGKENTTTTSKDKTTATSKGKPTTDKSNAATAAIYLYRDAQAGDDFAVFANLENAVVITGVSRPSANGVYTIPETLDGKRVIAIMGNAFCADSVKDTVKTVIVPATVKTVWNYAFANCYRLTDIYFLGNAVYVEGDAFADLSKRTGTLTIHCSAICTDRAQRYYKDAASRYDAQYKELSDTEIKAMYGGGGE